jgi:ABC-type molybdate transport system substrate-binding protein
VNGRAVLVAALVAMALVAGCSSDDQTGRAAATTEAPTSTRPLTGGIVVLATADLADAMSAVVREYQGTNTGATASVEVLPTADLVARVRAGGPGDVVALDDAAAMDDLEGNGLVAAVLVLPGDGTGRIGAVVASPNPAAATHFVELAGG